MAGKIFIFARTPQLGQVKTRLKPVLGDDGCLALHEKLVENTVQMATRAKVADVEVWHTGNADHPYWQALSTRYTVTLREQQGADLGERMLNAVSNALVEGASWVVVIGSDCPEIDSAYLAGAAKALESGSSLVIGPAMDGGYVLIGLRMLAPEIASSLFGDIDWGSERVLQQTLAQADKSALNPTILGTLRDLDDEDDWHHFRDAFDTT